MIGGPFGALFEGPFRAVLVGRRFRALLWGLLGAGAVGIFLGSLWGPPPLKFSRFEVPGTFLGHNPGTQSLTPIEDILGSLAPVGFPD